MTRRFACCALIAGLTSAPVALGQATPPPAGPAPATGAAPAAGAGLLGEKGLNKEGALYVLKTEKELLDGVKELNKAKAKMDAEQKDRLAIEKEISKAKNAFAAWEQERRGELEKLAKVKDAFQNNQIVAKIESLQDKMGQAMKYKEEQETKLRKLGDDGRAKYIQLVIDLAAGADKTHEQYGALAKEKEVLDAVAAAKGKLGPSPAFAQQFNFVKRLRAPVFSETIKLTFEGKVPMVEVTLNGSTIKKMVLDTGASYVCIPADLAKAMELVPAKDDPDVTLQLADGKLVQAKMTKIKSIRVGKFTLNDVEAAVLPAELVAAEPLLGGSFLNQFTMKIDTGKEELHLARIGGAEPAKEPAKKP